MVAWTMKCFLKIWQKLAAWWVWHCEYFGLVGQKERSRVWLGANQLDCPTPGVQQVSRNMWKKAGPCHDIMGLVGMLRLAWSDRGAGGELGANQLCCPTLANGSGTSGHCTFYVIQFSDHKSSFYTNLWNDEWFCKTFIIKCQRFLGAMKLNRSFVFGSGSRFLYISLFLFWKASLISDEFPVYMPGWSAREKK